MKHLLAVTALATGILASLPGLAQDKTVVSFLHKFPEPENMAYFDAAVAEFEAANPTIDIVMEAINDGVDEAEICLSVDLDVFAAGFAPGVSAPNAMGIAPDSAFRRVFRGIMASGRVRGVEIAELCPAFDIDDRTARLGAMVAFEAALGVLDGIETEQGEGEESEGDGSEDGDVERDEPNT